MRLLKTILPIVAIALLSTTSLWAQSPPPSAPPSAGAPIDGFSALLLAAGAGYAVKRLRKNDK